MITQVTRRDGSKEAERRRSSEKDIQKFRGIRRLDTLRRRKMFRMRQSQTRKKKKDN